jgi:hypothetical protein
VPRAHQKSRGRRRRRTLLQTTPLVVLSFFGRTGASLRDATLRVRRKGEFLTAGSTNPDGAGIFFHSPAASRAIRQSRRLPARPTALLFDRLRPPTCFPTTPAASPRSPRSAWHRRVCVGIGGKCLAGQVERQQHDPPREGIDNEQDCKAVA